MVPPDPAAGGPPPPPYPEPHTFQWKRRRWPLVVTIVSSLVVVAIVLALIFVRVPYVAVSPGSASPTENLVTVNGVDSYPADGDILFTTVRIKTRLQLWRAIQGWLDPATDVRPEEQILGDRSATENRQFNLALMDDSKITAVRVALEHLGYEVTSNGVLLVDIADGTDAATKLAAGDVVTRIDDLPVADTDDLREGITAHQPGDTVRIHLDPPADGGDPRDVDVVLGSQPDDPTMPLLGVQIQDYNVEFPIDVSIDSGGVGGPSAGLAFTLAILDVLTPGELTGGVEVAVTGTINADGTVGPVGGVTQKTEAVNREGAELFMVPTEEYADAVAQADDDLQVVAVDTLDDALEVLAGLGGNALALPTEPARPAA
jgi:PDZ domain-containing protein